MANIISGYDAAQLISEAGGGKSEKNVRNLADSGTIGRVQNAEGKVLGYDRESVERYVAELRDRGQAASTQTADQVVAAAPIADVPEYLRELLHQNATAMERVLELSSQLADARVKIVMLEAELRSLGAPDARVRRRRPTRQPTVPPADAALGPLTAEQREAESNAQADESGAPAPVRIATDRPTSTPTAAKAAPRRKRAASARS